MRRSKLLGLAFMAMFALTSIGATAASAETMPNILPLGTEAAPLVSQDKSGVSKFGSGVEVVESTESTSTESGQSEKLGTFHVTFLGSKSLALGQCQGTGDAAGTILVLGQFHVRDAKAGTTLITVLIFLLEQVHFSCGGVPIVVEGCVAGQIDNGTELTPTLTVLLKVKSGVNEIVTVLNETNLAEEGCYLLSSVNSEATVLSSQEQTATLEKFEKGTEKEIQVLVMPL